MVTPSHFLDVEDGKRIAYSVMDGGSDGFTFILAPSMGDLKEEYRFLLPLLYADGENTVISTDLRGMGESDVGFSSYSVEDTGRDLEKLVRHRAMMDNASKVPHFVLIGCSMSAAAVVYAAAQLQRQLVAGVIFLSPFLWDHVMPMFVPTLLSVCLHPRSCISASFWTSYYATLYTNQKQHPTPDLLKYISELKANLRQPGRAAALYSHVFSSKKTCEDQISAITATSACTVPCIAIFGSRDPDFPAIEDEARKVYSRFQPTSMLELPRIIPGVGHYPHVEAPMEVYTTIKDFTVKLQSTSLPP